jgi:hypothetical protein
VNLLKELEKQKDCPTPMVIKQMKEPPKTGSGWYLAGWWSCKILALSEFSQKVFTHSTEVQ